MKQQEAQALKALVEAADKRIKARVRPVGQGARLQLVLYPGSCNQRELLVGKAKDIDLVKSLWEGL